MMTQQNLPASRLQHRNIVAGTERPEGESLRKILDGGALPVARAIRIAHDIAAGLAHAHLEGVVHGGLTPSSIVVSRSGVARIAGFGGAKPAADHRSDVFALGALIYEMLARQAPVGDKPPPPSELSPHVPRALDAIVLSMLARQPADRMPGVPILLRELQRLEEGLGLGAGAQAVAGEPAASAPPRDAPWSALDDEAAQHRKRIIDREVSDAQRVKRDREFWAHRPSGSRPSVFAVLALVLAVLGIGFGGFLYYSSDASERSTAASRMQEAPAAAGPTSPPPPVATERTPLAGSDASPAAPAGSGLTVPASMAQAVKQPAPEPAPESAPESAPLPREPAPLPQPEKPVMQPTAKAAKHQPAGTAQLILAVSPGGELYVDGKHLGTTPPATSFDLPPGMYRVEVRSGSRKPFLTYITVEAGDVRRIRHDFDAKPSHPPE